MNFLIRFALAFLAALALSPVLAKLIPIFPHDWMTYELFGLSFNPVLSAVRLAIWAGLLLLLVRLLRPVFAFILPTTRRYGATKAMRRVHGVSTEAVLIGLIFLCVSLPAAAVSMIYQLRSVGMEERAEDWELQIIFQDIEEEEDTEFYAELRKASAKQSWDIYQERVNALMDEYDYLSDRQKLLAKRLAERNWREWNKPPDEDQNFDDIFGLPDEDDREELATPEPKPSPIRELSYRILAARSEWANRGLRMRVYQSRAESERKRLLEEYGSLTGQTFETPEDIAAIEDQLRREEAEARKAARRQAWEGFRAKPLNHFGAAYGRAWRFSLLLSLLVYGLTHYVKIKDKPVRSHFAERYTKLRVFIQEGKEGQDGSSEIAGYQEEIPLRFEDQQYGLFMGRSSYNAKLNIGLEDDRHMITIAGARTGKGTTVIIPNLLLWKGSALVIDPKGTNAAVTMRRRREMGQNVHLVDPFDVLGTGTTDAFNPLAVLDPNSPTVREDIYNIADALVVPDPGAKEKHWDDGARTILAGLIAHLITSPAFENPSLPMIRDMLAMLPEDQAELWADMSLNEGAGRLPKETAARIVRGIGTDEMAGLLSNADKHSEWLASPVMQKTLNTTTFTFADLKDKPTTVYLILPPHLLRTHNRFLRLFLNLAINQMSIGDRAATPVLMLIDEFLALGRMEAVEKAFPLMAGYNMVLWPFVQHLTGMKALYGDNVHGFMGNSRAVQVFGISDPETTKFVSEQMGNRTLPKRLSRNKANNVAKLRSPDEVARNVTAEKNRQYILRSGKNPLLIEKVTYYKDPMFAGQHDPDPDYS